MGGRYKYIVVGRGMMGAAAARHLAKRTDGVALVGPGEPKDHASHTGVFGSHYDEARITRTIDADPVWALLAKRSIDRYGEITGESGIAFYHETGCLIIGSKAGHGAGYAEKALAAAGRAGAAPAAMDDEALARRFPYFSFPQDSEGVHETRGAGYINPRLLLKAQAFLAAKAGAEIVPETVASIREEDGGVAVTTEEGRTHRAERVLVAAGGFTINPNLLPRPLALTVYARTVAFFEVDEPEQARLAGMPSLIHHAEEESRSIYLLPPVRYPDGRTYLKIGGDPVNHELPGEPEIRAWFRTGGRESTRVHLDAIIRDLLPGLRDGGRSAAACVTSFTPSGYPAIGFVPGSQRLAVLAGGCGAAAKSSDEIGRLGASLIFEGQVNDDAYGVDFAPQFL